MTRANTGFLEKYAIRDMPGLPKYAQLREMLVAAIRAGHWKPGEKLPTETQLTRATPFSLGTVQRALRALVEDGLVTRAQGSGTFVTQTRTPLDAPLHLLFESAEAEGGYLPVFPRIVSRTRVRERGPWSDFLGTNGRDLMRVDRLLSIDDEFSVYSRFYFDAATFKSIATRPLASLEKAHLKRMLANALDARITQVRQRIRMEILPAAICKAIGIKAGTAGMLLETTGGTSRGTPVYFLESFIPPNDRKLDVSGG